MGAAQAFPPNLWAEGPAPKQHRGSWKDTPATSFAGQLFPCHGQRLWAQPSWGKGHFHAPPPRPELHCLHYDALLGLEAGPQGNALESAAFYLCIRKSY